MVLGRLVELDTEIDGIQRSKRQLEMTMPSGGTVPQVKKVGLMGLLVPRTMYNHQSLKWKISLKRLLSTRCNSSVMLMEAELLYCVSVVRSGAIERCPTSSKRKSDA